MMTSLADGFPGVIKAEDQVRLHSSGLVIEVDVGAPGLGETEAGGPVGLLLMALSKAGVAVNGDFTAFSKGCVP
eukprot:4316407-Alexandrium_andersonii.AAC.1